MPVKADRLSLFVFVDAFGWELHKRLGFMPDLLTRAAPLNTIFGYSSTCDPTILTGKMPREHGHFSFFYYNPKDSPFALCRCLSILPRSITRRGRVRRMMSRVIRRLYGFTGYFQIYNMPFRHITLFDYSEKRDLYQPGGIISGAPTIFDHLRGNRIPFYLSDWTKGEEYNLKMATDAISRSQPRFGYLYLAAMDAILHQWGTLGPQADAKVAWYADRLGRLYDLAASKYRQVDLFVFSDHGMANITEQCPLMSRIEKLGLKMGKDYAAVYDSTMARFWFLNDLARQRIVSALKEEPRGDIMSQEQLCDFGCDFADNKYGELFFLMKPGVLLCPSFMGETPLAGMHGYDPADKDSVAMIATNAMSAKLPRRLDGLYDLMMSELE